MFQLFSRFSRFSYTQSCRNLELIFCKFVPVVTYLDFAQQKAVFQKLFLSCGMELHFQYICKPSPCRYSARSEVALDLPLKRTNIGQKVCLFYLGPNRIKSTGQATTSSLHALKKDILNQLQNQLNPNYHFITFAFTSIVLTIIISALFSLPSSILF